VEGENRDLLNLTLFGEQQRMLNDVLASAPPMGVVVVLLTCTPMDVASIVADDRVSAIIHAGYPQHTGGYGVIDTILGRSNPSAKLPFTWPYADTVSLDGENGLTNYTMIGTNKTYRYQGYQGDKAPTSDEANDKIVTETTDAYSRPLFPFAYGLSYTTFAFSNLTITPSAIQPCAAVTVRVRVRNTGAREGAEVAQIYIRWVTPGQRTPKLQLVNFEKVLLPAGGEQEVALTIDARRMALLEVSPPVAPTSSDWVPPAWWVKPGKIEVFVGGNQPGYGETLAASFMVEGTPTAVTSC
jgi:beta-glucosidase